MNNQSSTPSRGPENLRPYRHRQLIGAQRMRVLRVFPAPRGSDEIVRCKLEHAENARIDNHGYADHLERLHGYEALSWTWGLGSYDQAIRIHENNTHYSFRVYSHLYEALVALRDPAYSRYLWIDAICIDQTNIPERNLQVARMSEVYGDANNVCIWLGKATLESTIALSFIKDEVLKVHTFDELCKNPIHIDSWAALLGLMKREWFGRRWIVQEVALARRATMHCGAEYIDWQNFAAAVSLLVDVDTSAPRLSALVKKEERFGYADNFFDEVTTLGAARLVDATSRLFKRAVGGVPQRTSALEDIVARLANFETSEPRDTIYALLALAKDSQPFVKGIPDYLDGTLLTAEAKRALQLIARVLPNTYQQSYVVDYEQRIIDVYQQFISFAIARSDPTRALDIICRPFAPSYTKAQDISYDSEARAALQDPNTIVQMPSWVPNISEIPFVKRREENPERTGVTYSMHRQRGDPFVSSPELNSYSRYSAAGSRQYNKDKVRFRKRQDHYSMFVEGFILDTVSEVDAASQLGNIPAKWLKRAERTHQKDPDMFWRTMVADRGPKGRAPLFYKNVFEAALRNASSESSFDIDRQIRTSSSELIKEVLRQVQATIWERSLFETTHRGLIGLGSEKMLPGDRICILYGCSVPVILRRFEKTRADIESEEKADEEDRLVRQEKSRNILLKLFQSRTLSPAPPSPAPQSFARALLEPTGQLLFLLIASAAVTYGLDERLAASLPTLVALPHIFTRLREIRPSSQRSWHGSFGHAHGIPAILMMTTAAATVILFTGVRSTLNAFILVIAFASIFPEILPSEMSGPLTQIICRVTMYSSALLSLGQNAVAPESTTHSTGSLGSTHPDEPAFTSTTRGNRRKSGRGVKNVTRHIPDGTVPHHYYALIGECYVHEMMDGEAIKLQNESSQDDPEMRLRPGIFELR